MDCRLGKLNILKASLLVMDIFHNFLEFYNKTFVRLVYNENTAWLNYVSLADGALSIKTRTKDLVRWRVAAAWDQESWKSTWSDSGTNHVHRRGAVVKLCSSYAELRNEWLWYITSDQYKQWKEKTADWLTVCLLLSFVVCHGSCSWI